MVCDLCGKREAIIFLEKMNENIKKRINLCTLCATKRKIVMSDSVPPPPQNVDAAFAEVAERERKNHPDSKTLCPSCGANLYDIKQKGIIGCSECYEVFKNEIIEAMTQHGIYGPYTGTMPYRIEGFRSTLTIRSDIQAKLDAAVKAENYEKAAVYRDYLRALEKGSVADGSIDSENGESDDDIE